MVHKATIFIDTGYIACKQDVGSIETSTHESKRNVWQLMYGTRVPIYYGFMIKFESGVIQFLKLRAEQIVKQRTLNPVTRKFMCTPTRNLDRS